VAAEVGLIHLDVPLELLQLGLPSGGDALANDTLVLGERTGMDAGRLCRSGRGCFKPQQRGDQLALFYGARTSAARHLTCCDSDSYTSDT